MNPEKFSLFENTNWSSAEEISLLEAISEFGYGNWLNISRRIVTRNPDECKEHYNTFYINKPSELLPKIPKTNVLTPNIVTPYNFRLKNIEEPPRCEPNSITYNNLAGYSAARSDFEYPYDSNAETIITNLSSTYSNLENLSDVDEDMACAVFKAYNNRLRERQRRLEVIRAHGIVSRKQFLFFSKYENSLPRHTLERFLGFTQFLSPLDFDFIMHSLFRQTELKNYLHRLKDLRLKGIRTFHGARLYVKLKERREDFYSDVQNYFNRPDVSLNKSFNDCDVPFNTTVPNKRAIAGPLDIIGLPCFDRLSDDEKKLCSQVRIVPESYLELKRILIAECEKLNGLRLQDARKAIRIDVNKTRKLYDFLIEQGLIFKPNVT
ncbi:transcriptional adapter 2-alpha [Chrysoperla carnea]|uniref:transcriptional adapter 2-alpha n=1 Tax=Chrysoperla carnea TaxID=189513 RepID=UPI001D082843|nr:transcriptional adapter 2-alpha [Chrysoperla carnea]